MSTPPPTEPEPEPEPAARIALRWEPLLAALLAGLRAALPDLSAVYVFGSQAQGTASRHSDLDLAVLAGGPVDPVQLWRLAGDLASLAGCPVDLVDLRAASTVMQYQVLTTGQRLWADESAAGLFECRVLSEKTALDEARAGLLADILADGTVGRLAPAGATGRLRG